LCTIEDGALRIGLRTVRGLPELLGRRLVEERARRPYRSLADLARRVPLRRPDLVALAEAGAFSGLGLDRRAALCPVHALAGAGPLDAPPPEEPSPLEPMNAREQLDADYAVLGLTTGPHPMALDRSRLGQARVLRASDLGALRDGTLVRVGGVAIVRQRPGTAKGFFFLTLEDETGFVNVIVTPRRFLEARATLLGANALIIEGKLQKQDGAIAVRGRHFEAWPTHTQSVSRDFH